MLSVTSLRPGALDRRQMLQVGAFGAVGLSLPQLLCAEALARAARKKSCILVFANGGPAQLDTFDLKPDAPAEIKGEFKPIATSVEGIQISEHLPRVARLMHHGAIIRSMSTVEADHDRGRYLMHTGYPRGSGGVPWPSLGALVSSELGQPGFLLRKGLSDFGDYPYGVGPDAEPYGRGVEDDGRGRDAAGGSTRVDHGDAHDD